MADGSVTGSPGAAAAAPAAAAAAAETAAQANKRRQLLQQLQAKHAKGKNASKGPWRCCQPEGVYGADGSLLDVKLRAACSTEGKPVLLSAANYTGTIPQHAKRCSICGPVRNAALCDKVASCGAVRFCRPAGCCLLQHGHVREQYRPPTLARAHSLAALARKQLWRGQDEEEDGEVESGSSSRPPKHRRLSPGGASGSTGGAVPLTAGGEEDLLQIAELQQRKGNKPQQQPVAKFFLPASMATEFKQEWATASAVAGLSTVQVSGRARFGVWACCGSTIIGSPPARAAHH